MRLRRRLLLYVVPTTLVLLLIGAGIALAQGPDANQPASTQATVSSAFTYQGRLVRAGTPVNDTCDFQFDLFAQASGGSSLQTIQKNSHAVTDGRFTVDLGFAASHFSGDARWLEVAVKCSGDSSFQTLGRQRLRPTPYATGLMPGATISGTVSGGGVLKLNNATDDGLQITSAADNGIHIESAAINGIEIDSAKWGIQIDEVADDGLNVLKAGSPSTTSSTAARVGVEVQGAEDYGLYVGRADNDGIRVHSSGDDGVQVESADYGFYAESVGSDGVLVGDADNYGIFVSNGDADGDGIGGAGFFGGNVQVTGHLTTANLEVTGSKNFVIDHPQDPENKLLYHSSVESPDRMNVYNGNVTLDENGEAEVQLPDYFEALNRDFRYQLTPIGGPGPDLYIAEEVQNNSFKIAGGTPGLKVSWQVTGIRDDAAARANPMQVEVEKPDDKKGRYINPEVHGQPASKAMHASKRTGKEDTQ